MVYSLRRVSKISFEIPVVVKDCFLILVLAGIVREWVAVTCLGKELDGGGLFEEGATTVSACPWENEENAFLCTSQKSKFLDLGERRFLYFLLTGIHPEFGS
jgi:hypothetical protein